MQCIDGTNNFQDASISSINNGLITASVKSHAACKNGQISAIWSFINTNKWVMFSLLLIGGLFICFAGRLLFKPIIYIVSLSVVTSFILVIAYNTFLLNNDKIWVGWLVLTIAVLAGLAAGCCVIRIIKLAIFVVAAWGGFAFSLLIYNAFMYKMNSEAGFWCFTLGVALVCGVLSLCFYSHILIHATAFLGSYMAIFGIGLVAGHYTNPFTIVEMIRNNQIDHVDPIFYAYMAGNLALYFLGMLFQYRQKNGNPHDDPYQYGKRY